MPLNFVCVRVRVRVLGTWNEEMLTRAQSTLLCFSSCRSLSFYFYFVILRVVNYARSFDFVPRRVKYLYRVCLSTRGKVCEESPPSRALSSGSGI